MNMIQNPLFQYMLFAVLAAVPMARVFKRMGRSPFYAAILAVPYVGFVLCLAILAARKKASSTPSRQEAAG